ncbi:secreted RxLR effector protein 161-like [Nymphaea colorata]|nr:secreted RxLR effector protein 161-like [Nymphaea colorata]
MEKCKDVVTPAVPNLPLSQHEGEKLMDATLCRSIVGALQYVTLTRPDISFAINKACQFTHDSSDLHWGRVKRILRYLQGTSTYGLQIQKNQSMTLEAYADVDWAGCPDDRRSTSGFVTLLGGNIISWGSTRQHTVARSSTKVEYEALAIATSEIIWLKSLLKELKVHITGPPILRCDNLGATYLAADPVSCKNKIYQN